MDAIVQFFSSLHWQDILDIFIGSYILFRLYALFRGTAAFRVMLGVAFLWIFQVLSLKLGLIVISYAIQRITAVAPIIIVVIFRNEIRTVFQTKNVRAIFWGTPQKVQRTSIETVSESIFELAEKKVGALLVYPGKDDLDEQVQNGIPWEGMVSREMVKSIFWKGNPVHDGAVIVDGDRISQVACILPLSLRDDLPVYFGTRHRAAVGLSEKSDALTVMASEETGRVMTAKGGTYRYPSTRGELQEILEEHLGQRSAFHANAKRNERFEMIAAICISFLLIYVAWSGFTQSSDTLVSFDVPIQYTGRALGVDIVDASTDVVKVQLIGAGTLIKSVRSEKLAAIVDLSRLPMGSNTIKILPEAISYPRGVNVNRITPSAIEVTLDRYTNKQLPVQIDWKGKLLPDLLLTEAVVEPASVQVAGRSLVLRELGTLYTEPILLDKIQQSGNTSALILFPENIKPSSGQKDRVTVTYTVVNREDLHP